MRLLHRDVEFDLSSKRTSNLPDTNLSIVLFTLYRSFDKQLREANFFCLLFFCYEDNSEKSTTLPQIL